MYKKMIWPIIVFIVVVIISGWLGIFVDSMLPEQPKSETLGMAVWLVLPVLTAIILLLLSKGTWKDIGLKPNFKGNIKWYIAAVLIFPVITAIVLLLGASAKWIDLSSFNLSSFALAFCGALLVGFVKDIFEETAWRGFLTSQLIKLNLKDWKLYLIVGSVWGIWHIPYYAFFLSSTDIQAVLPVSRIMFAIIAIITMCSWAVMYIEIYRITKSIWPCVIMHAVEDALINPLILQGFITIANGKEILISPIVGIITSVLYLTIGLIIRAYRIQLRQTAISNQ